MKNTSKLKFVDSSGKEISAHRFKNPDGSVGGWVADNARIGSGSFVSSAAIVGPNATVRPGRVVYENQEVWENETY